MKHYTYEPKGVCSVQMDFDIDDDNKVHNLVVTGGCNGNLKGIASLIEGQDKDEVIKRLKGIQCGFRKTSCPDQLSKALENVK
ncbi:MAG: TIGR03905 family TSCPD domain-containing protein [Bacilli bacterium]|nr:TIGR03905 family TSCPD domain-containing protein [Bacilli bacterium]